MKTININTEIRSLTHNSNEYYKATYFENKFVIQLIGTKITDWLIVIFFFLILFVFLYPAFFNGILSFDFYNFALTFGGFYILFFLSTRGDNVLTIDFLKRKLFIKRRFFLFKFIPLKSIKFDSISRYTIKEDYGLNDSSNNPKHFDISAIKKNLFFKKVMLFSFHENQKKQAYLLLTLLRKTNNQTITT